MEDIIHFGCTAFSQIPLTLKIFIIKFKIESSLHITEQYYQVSVIIIMKLTTLIPALQLLLVKYVATRLIFSSQTLTVSGNIHPINYKFLENYRTQSRTIISSKQQKAHRSVCSLYKPSK